MQPLRLKARPQRGHIYAYLCHEGVNVIVNTLKINGCIITCSVQSDLLFSGPLPALLAPPTIDSCALEPPCMRLVTQAAGLGPAPLITGFDSQLPQQISFQIWLLVNVTNTNLSEVTNYLK